MSGAAAAPPVTVTLGNGNDTVTLANRNNTVTLGNGHDTVMIGQAANTAMGGREGGGRGLVFINIWRCRRKERGRTRGWPCY